MRIRPLGLGAVVASVWFSLAVVACGSDAKQRAGAEDEPSDREGNGSSSGDAESSSSSGGSSSGKSSSSGGSSGAGGSSSSSSGGTSACDDGSWAVPGTGTCTRWSDCTAGSYVQTAGTSTSDRVCAPCAAGTVTTWPNAETCVSPTPRSIVGGQMHTCLLREGGGVQCWGNDAEQQLSNGSVDFFTTSPVVAEGVAGGIQITSGASHTCVLRVDGTVKCWGRSVERQLGSLPDLAGVTHVDAGAYHTCATLETGRVTCWGLNDHGQLGNQSSVNSIMPVEVSGLRNAKEVAAGQSHTCALLTTGKVECWGSSTSFQLGIGSVGGDVWSPAEVRNLADVTHIVSGNDHTCALLQDGTVKCWGNNGSGQQGLGTRTTSGLAKLVPNVSGVVQLSSGANHVCARLASGTLTCWGRNSEGQIGIGTKVDQLTAVAVPGLAGVAHVGAAPSHTCAILASGEQKCWGLNEYGQLGDGTRVEKLVPTTVVW